MRLLAELEELRDATFESLMPPFVPISMDVRSGEELLLDTGLVLEGTRPSFAMPGIFPLLAARPARDGRWRNGEPRSGSTTCAPWSPTSGSRPSRSPPYTRLPRIGTLLGAWRPPSAPP